MTIQLKWTRTDTVSGMFFSNLIMYFIILTTAATLTRPRPHRHHNGPASC